MIRLILMLEQMILASDARHTYLHSNLHREVQRVKATHVHL